MAFDSQNSSPRRDEEGRLLAGSKISHSTRLFTPFPPREGGILNGRNGLRFAEFVTATVMIKGK
jgi:hypothetical protein